MMHPTKPRIVEIIEFAKGMGYKRVGEAYCGEVGPLNPTDRNFRNK